RFGYRHQLLLRLPFHPRQPGLRRLQDRSHGPDPQSRRRLGARGHQGQRYRPRPGAYQDDQGHHRPPQARRSNVRADSPGTPGTNGRSRWSCPVLGLSPRLLCDRPDHSSGWRLDLALIGEIKMMNDTWKQLVDVDRLTAWMDERGLEHGLIEEASPLTGGTQNLLLRFRRGQRHFVLRRPPLHPRMDGTATMQREARVLGALAGTRVPHARLIASCDDKSVLGSGFYLMEPVE